ncbi:MAG: iron-containing alcohol dehydrogenase [Spirochaetia bacterium]|nr:iron-containing alcohol dehydrogenase [Spirochaetia bacterium]
MENWVHFTLPTRIHFENNCLLNIGKFIRNFGGRALLINIRKENHTNEKLEELKSVLSDIKDGCIVYEDLIADPDTEQIDSATYFAKKSHADIIVAFGSIDTFNTAKAVALLAPNSFFASDLMDNDFIPKINALPVITVPIEPSMGEEMNPGFSLVDAKTGRRKYFEHEMLYPKAVFYDPLVSSYITSDRASRIGGALLSYAIETTLSKLANPITTTFSHKAIESLKKNIILFYNDPKNQKLAEVMMWNSAMIGASICGAPVGASWAIAMALNTEAQIDFHYAISLVLPHVMEYFLTNSPGKYLNIARSLQEDVSEISVIEAAIKAVEGVRKLFVDINLPSRLSEFDITKQSISEIAETALLLPQISNSPRFLNKNEIESILLSAF